ncbi:MAG TPA: helix-turn-helix domain-containing protein, partial [Opitutaceae bacterium]|nr:helix-turn-helix domain-containing protein [Opitutaceae bacterium]
MLTHLQPSPRLRTWVDCYLYVRDLEGVHCDRAVTTAPRPGGVLTINFGRPNRMSDGAATPVQSLLGIQTRTRTWLPDADSHFVMVLLTPAGLAALAPRAGAGLTDRPVELSGILRNRQATGLFDAASRVMGQASQALDTWLLAHFAAAEKIADVRLAQSACVALAMSNRVEVAARHLGISRRHLARTLSHHLGVSPKSLIDLYRLNRSVRAVQRGADDSADGFADQAHQ